MYAYEGVKYSAPSSSHYAINFTTCKHMHAWFAISPAIERHELDFLDVGLAIHDYLTSMLKMASRSIITNVSSKVSQASNSKKTAESIASTLLERKEFSPELNNALPDFAAARHIFKQRDGNTVVRSHLPPLLKRYRLSTTLVPCLIYKQIPLGSDERTVMDHRNENSRWKVRDFPGHRDQAVPRTLHFCDRSYSIFEYQLLPAKQAPGNPPELDQYAELFGTVYQLLKTHELDKVIGLRRNSGAAQSPVEADSAAFYT